jgi:hypothetical protein
LDRFRAVNDNGEEEELEEAKRKRDQYEDRMAESEYDADRLAEEREDSNGGYSV